LLTAEAAHRIAKAQGPAFHQLGYRCDPDPTLAPDEALANWERFHRREPALTDFAPSATECPR
jgi:hypothetical protein